MAAPMVSLSFFGINALIKFFTTAAMAAEYENRRGNWYVVSVVEYGEPLEFGTRDRPARPHWRIAIHTVTGEIADQKHVQRDLLNVMVAGGNMTRKIAERLRAEIRRQIRARGLIDTGNYYGSIGIGNTRAEAVADSYNRLIDPSTALVEVR